MRGHVRVRTAPFCPAPLVVPPLADGFRAGVRDEMVIDVVHVRDHRVRGEHRGREHPLQLQRVGPVRDRGQAGPQSPQGGQRDEPGQRPGLGRGQVLERLRRRGTEREACADRRQQRYVPAAASCPAAAANTSPAPARAANACSNIAPAYRDRTRPAPPPARPAACRQAGTGPAQARPGFRLRPASGAGCGFLRIRFRLRFRPGVRPGRVLHVRPPGRADRGLVHPQPPRDLRVPHSPRPPCPRLLPLLPGPFPGPPGRADQRRRPLPQRPLAQRRDVTRGQPQHRGDVRPREPQLPQPGRRDVPHRRIVRGEPEQLHRPGEDHRLPATCPGGADHGAKASRPGWRRQLRTYQ